MNSAILFILLLAQTQMATIRGVIQDSSGNRIPGAILTLTNVAQGRTWTAQTNEIGAYAFSPIPPSDYTLRVEATGFRKVERSGLTLQVAQVANLDLTMEIGAISETVEVFAQAPILESASSTLGEVVNSRTTEALPLNGRNSLQLIALVPGVGMTPSFITTTIGNGVTDAVGFNVNGGRNLSNTILLDGSPQEVPAFNEAAFVPNPDTLQEFRVQTNALAAEYGRTSGGVINIVHRSGGREFHGVLYELLRNDKLDANNFFNNRNNRQRAPFRYNQFGFTAGGPLTPSRQSTFFFASYEGVRQVNSGSTFFTVPTVRMRRGDFGEIVDPIYDPSTADASGQRTAFPNNVIPANRLNPVGLKIISFYPEPNRPGIANNFFSQIGSRPSNDIFSVKVDHQISSRQNVFVRYSSNDFVEELENYFHNLASPNAGNRAFRTQSATLDDTYTWHGWVLHGNYGWAYRANPRSSPEGEVLPSSLGFPSSLDSVVQFKIFPRIQPSGYAELGGNAFWIIRNEFETHTLSGDASKLFGRHTIKLGGTYRLNRVSNRQPISPSGLYNFDESWTRQFINRGTGGNTMASLLLGLPASGQLQVEPYLATQVVYDAAFIQDDWRVNRRLTVNVGLRWDSDRPLTERYDRASSFDFDAALPIQVSQLGTLHGGMRFAGRNGQPRGIRNPDNNNFAPRLGLAYRVSDKFVVRSGGGIVYAGITGDGPSAGRIGGLGFNAITSVVSSVDGGRTPYSTLSNPFPNGLNQPTNDSQGLLTFIGGDTFVVSRKDRVPYIAQWNLDLEYEVPGNAMIDVAYAGNAGVHLLGTDPELNQLPDQYLSLGDALSATVPNPFFGIIPASQPLGGPTTTRGQLLRPFPQYTSMQQQKASEFHSSYHSLQVKFRKRYSSGLQFLGAYTWSKLIDDGSSVGGFLGQQNPTYTNNNKKYLDRSISGLDIAHRLVVNYQWELPFGKNAAGAVKRLIDGWSINGITTLQSGLPISVTSRNNTTNSFGGVQRPNSTGISSETPGSAKDRIDQWFDVAAFSNAPAFTFGNIGRFLPDNRGPAFNNWDISILKDISFTERVRMQFRTEMFNAFNHPNFKNPSGNSTVFGRPEFGTITAAFPARSIQFGLKLFY
jgi:hypothetical protein